MHLVGFRRCQIVFFFFLHDLSLPFSFSQRSLPQVFKSVQVIKSVQKSVYQSFSYSLHAWRSSHYIKGSVRNGSVIKSTCCSRRGLGFDFQQTHGSSHLPVTLVPGNLMPSSGLHGLLNAHRPHAYTDTHTQHK